MAREGSELGESSQRIYGFSATWGLNRRQSDYMRIFVNGEPNEYAKPLTVQILVQAFGMGDGKGVAISVNDQVVPRATWADRVLEENDRVVVVRATRGG